jgi:hypothetical protein
MYQWLLQSQPMAAARAHTTGSQHESGLSSWSCGCKQTQEATQALHAAVQLLVDCQALISDSDWALFDAVGAGTYWAICGLAVPAVFSVVALHPAAALQYSAGACAYVHRFNLAAWSQ